jgi:DNA polymerase-4
MINENKLIQKTEPYTLFVDMNSFFASCEQQVNYWLRGRPVAVCVYTGKYGCVIAPSIEAKQKGIKLGMRLDEAIKLCPDLVPLETRPERYREYHAKIIAVLKRYSNEVIPKSIDEAVVDLTNYKLIYKDPIVIAKKIKQDIKKDVGDWLKCSIGIAPNSFLAKLASDIKKPDGITLITPQNIDSVLSKLKLQDIPGIGERMEQRLLKAGIDTPLKLRYAAPEQLKKIFNGVSGLFWYYRLNFSEMDMMSHAYKTMQAMRQLSREQRKSTDTIYDVLLMLCLTLEKRMVQHRVAAKKISFYLKYENDTYWNTEMKLERPLQDGIELLNRIKKQMAAFEKKNKTDPLINTAVKSIGVSTGSFTDDSQIQYSLFDTNYKKDVLRKVMYDLKDKFGKEKLLRAAELKNSAMVKDVIGFGSVKDIHPDYDEMGF